jgi:hypothetical protein
MDMKVKETLSRATALLFGAFRSKHEEPARIKIRGDVFIKLRDAGTQELLQEHTIRNLIVKDASILVARLFKDSSEPLKGAFVLAVGTGDTGWNPMAPPSPTGTQRALYSELTRKTFTSTQFIDADGVPTATPTNVVDFTTIFTEAEAVGPLVEMALLGGNISTNMSVRNPVTPPNGSYDPTVDLTQYETMINYLTFLVVNKPATSTLEVTWRLSF